MPALSACYDAATEARATMNLLRLEVVLAAIDYDDAAPAVLEAGRKLAEAAGAKLHVAHVDPPRGGAREAAGEGEATPSHSMLALLEHAKVDRDTPTHVIAGEPANVIPDLADRLEADVIVLGPHRELRATEGRMGSTALAIATASRVPCLIVTHDMHLPLARVLAPVDMSDTARGALKVALSWSSALRHADATDRKKGSEKTCLIAIHVDDATRGARRGAPAKPPLDAEVDQVRREAGTWSGVTMQSETIPSDDVVETIADRAREEHVDLVVLGTRGAGRDRAGRLGSVSDAVMRRVDTPVLLVPPAVWTDVGSR
jgi:nucleotide-binding universal stress UspA family protein